MSSMNIGGNVSIFRGEGIVLPTSLYRNETKAYRDEVMSYVVPTEATLSPEAIKDLVNKHRTENFFGFNF